jgi:NAD(P)-dependent dehydrogenase (short-subunit alcohol dehydrogenase family)
MSGLRGKVALVTGSSRGIGAALAKLIASEAAKVAVHGRDAAALSARRDDIERAGGRAISVAADVTKLTEIVDNPAATGILRSHSTRTDAARRPPDRRMRRRDGAPHALRIAQALREG